MLKKSKKTAKKTVKKAKKTKKKVDKKIKKAKDSVVAFPDVSKTPTPAGPIPIPYPNISKISKVKKTVKKVKKSAKKTRRIRTKQKKDFVIIMSPQKRKKIDFELKTAIRELEVLRETIRNKRQMTSTQFENANQKASQYMNMLSSVLKNTNEIKKAIIRNIR